MIINTIGVKNNFGTSIYYVQLKLKHFFKFEIIDDRYFVDDIKVPN